MGVLLLLIKTLIFLITHWLHSSIAFKFPLSYFIAIVPDIKHTYTNRKIKNNPQDKL